MVDGRLSCLFLVSSFLRTPHAQLFLQSTHSLDEAVQDLIQQAKEIREHGHTKTSRSAFVNQLDSIKREDAKIERAHRALRREV